MIFRPAQANDRSAWQELLAASPAGDFLHDWEWAAVAALDRQPQQRFVLEEGERLSAIVAAQARRLPGGRAFWYVPHGPVLDYAAPGAGDRLRAILDGLRSHARQAGAIAVRLEPRLEKGSAGTTLLDRAGLRWVGGHLQVGYTRIVALRSDDRLLSSFAKDTRYSIRRAAREGVEVTTTTDPAETSAVDELYDLTVVTQRRARFPMRRRERYQLIWRAFAGAGRAAIFQAHHGQRSLASALMLIEGDRSFYFLAGSVRERPGEQKLFASEALQWALMRHARQHGAREHDLWGIAPPDAGPEHNWYGVGLFKKGFGGREVEWAGMWDLVVEPVAYWARELAHPALALARRVRQWL